MPKAIARGEAQRLARRLAAEIARGIVGQEEFVRGLVVAVVAGGHVLIEGVPGLGKTRAVNLLARACQVTFKRLQFTPDLLPADILGTRIWSRETARFETVRGPIFANFILADEINRAPAKVQSALLETMQERQVTIGRESLPLQLPFHVFATQNPVEQEGTYPLPEAQLDRFMMKLVVGYPDHADEDRIVRMVIDETALPAIEAVLDSSSILSLQRAAQEIFVEERVVRYATELVRATRRQKAAGLDLARFVELGASPRASISLIEAGRASALIDGRDSVLPDDVKGLAHAVMRHRIVPTYYAEAEGVTPDRMIDEVLSAVEVP